MIPRTYHFVLPAGRFHLAHMLSLRSCLETNRPERIHLYCGEEPSGRYWREIAGEVTVHRDDVWCEALPAASAEGRPWWHLPGWKRRILERTAEHGGVYADLGTLFVRPFPDELFEAPFVIAEAPCGCRGDAGTASPGLGTAFWMAAAGSPFARCWLDSWRADEDGDPLLPTSLWRERPSDVVVRASPTVYPFPPSAPGIAALFDDPPSEVEGAEAIHLWPTTWWSWRDNTLTCFHEGQLDEDFVRRGDTTYGRAARPFLPRRSASARARVAAGRQAKALGEWGRRRLAETRVLAHLALYRLVGERWLPHGREGVIRAKRKRAFLEALRHLELGAGIDQAIVATMTLEDEYGLIGRHFSANDVIVDVGAHVGTFSYLCHRRGSRRIFAFEPDPTTFTYLERNLGHRRGIRIGRRAVFRSDRGDVPLQLRPSGRSRENSGSVNVLFDGLNLGIHTQDVWGRPSTTSERVDAVALDDVLRECGRVKLLKLDCEGSEFPILMTSRELDRVEEIVGEYHEILPEAMESLAPVARVEGVDAWRVSTIVEVLSNAGFEVTTTPAPAPYIGIFRATRAPMQTSRESAG